MNVPLTLGAQGCSLRFQFMFSLSSFFTLNSQSRPLPTRSLPKSETWDCSFSLTSLSTPHSILSLLPLNLRNLSPCLQPADSTLGKTAVDLHPGDCGSLFANPSPWSPFLLPSPKAERPFSCTSDGTTDSLICLQFFSIASRTKSKLGRLTTRPFSPANLISHTHPPPQRDLLPDMISFFLPLCLYRNIDSSSQTTLSLPSLPSA